MIRNQMTLMFDNIYIFSQMIQIFSNDNFIRNSEAQI